MSNIVEQHNHHHHHRSKFHEQLKKSEVSTIIMPDLSIIDLPHIPILWGAFNPDLFLENRGKLMGLKNQKLTIGQKDMLTLLSDENIVKFKGFFSRFNQWTEVTDNIVAGLGITQNIDLTTSLTPSNFDEVLRKQLQETKGNIVVMSRPHSILFDVHTVLRKEMENSKNTKVAEIVFDRHLDTVINPGINTVTSGNVYFYLTNLRLIHAPVIFGPDNKLVKIYKNMSEVGKMAKLLVPNINDIKEPKQRELIVYILNQLKKWGITNITFTVDLDVLSDSESSFAVRYSPITPYLALGCQVLPDIVTPKDIDSMMRLQYPTEKVLYFLQESQVVNGQQVKFVRQFSSGAVKDLPKFPLEAYATDLGNGQGLKVAEVLKLIETIKEELPNFGIKDGIKLKSGGIYRGSVVEMCGFEDIDKKTSNAAIKLNQAIAS